MRLPIWNLGLIAAAAIAAQPVAAATTIDFDAFEPLTSLSRYTEDGFAVTRVSGDFQIGLGDPYPGLSNTGTATLDITYDSPARFFSLIRFILGNESSKGPASFTVTGFVEDMELYTASYQLSTSIFLQPQAAPQPTQMVDRVRITSSGYRPFLDGLVVEPFVPMAVPEPATWAMMVIGLGAVGSAMRRRAAGRVTVRS